MKGKSKYTIFLDSFDVKQVDAFGLRSRSLYDLLQLNVGVPTTFFINSKAFDDFIHQNELKDFIVEKLLKVDINNARDLEKTSKEIKEVILKGNIYPTLREEIVGAYSRLSGFSNALVSVTYSPINEDLDYSTFSGKPFTIMNIRGEEDLLNSIKEIWASLFEPKAIFYREAKRYAGVLTIAIVVQKLPFAEASGILFTVDPISNDPTKAQIEAILGVIDPLISSELTPDIYIFDKGLNTIVEKNTVTQDWMLVRKGRVKDGENAHTKVNISPVYKKAQKIDDNYIDYLGKLTLILDKYNKDPLEVEWIVESGKVSITNIKPITTLTIKDADWKFAPTVTALKSKLESVKRTIDIEQPKEEVSMPQQVQDYEKQMVEASEEIIEKDITPIVPIISKEEVIEEKLVEKKVKDETAVKQNKDITTATKVYYQVKSLNEVEKISEVSADGVITSFSKALLEKGIASNLLEAASRAEYHPVIFSLYSGSDIDEKEIKKQLTTLKLVRNKNNKKNVWVAFPAFSEKESIVEVKKLISTVGLKRSSTLKVFLTINSPAAALQVRDFIELGIDGVIVNYQELAAHSLGRKKDDVKVTDLLKHNAIEKILTELITNANKSKIESFITFDYLEVPKEVLEKLVEIGVLGIGTHLSVIPEMKSQLQTIEASKILKKK